MTRRRSLVALLAAGLVAGGCAGPRPEGPVTPVPRPCLPADDVVAVGRPYFDFTAPLLDGGRLTLSEVLGERAVLLQFWSITCAPCLEEIPLLAEIQATYGPLGLRVFGVNIDNGDPTRLRQALEARGLVIPYPVALDPERAVATHYAPWAVPVTVLVDRDGVVRAVHTGYKPELAPVIKGEVGRLLER